MLQAVGIAHVNLRKAYIRNSEARAFDSHAHRYQSSHSRFCFNAEQVACNSRLRKGMIERANIAVDEHAIDIFAIRTPGLR